MADARHGQNAERRQTTTQQRSNWAPACAIDRVTVELHGEGRVTVDRRVVPAVEALDRVLVAHGYETRRADTGAYNCRRITGGTGYSLHAYGIAVDINWTTNPYGARLVTDMPRALVDDVLAITTVSGARVWEWGGDWSGNRDAMHYEIDCTPADLATGIRHTPPRPSPPPPPGGFLMSLTADQQRQVLASTAATALRVQQLQEELVEPIDSQGRSRADRMARLPDAVRDLDRRLDRIEAMLARLVDAA